MRAGLRVEGLDSGRRASTLNPVSGKKWCIRKSKTLPDVEKTC